MPSGATLMRRAGVRQGRCVRERLSAVRVDAKLWIMDSAISWTSLLYLLGVLVLVGPALWALRRNRRWPVYLAAWLGIALALGLAYRVFGP